MNICSNFFPKRRNIQYSVLLFIWEFKGSVTDSFKPLDFKIFTVVAKAKGFYISSG
jgi:hypothetical protein